PLAWATATDLPAPAVAVTATTRWASTSWESNPSRRSRGTTPTGVSGTMILRRITRGRSTDGADIPTPVRRPCYRCAPPDRRLIDRAEQRVEGVDAHVAPTQPPEGKG